MIFTFDRTIPSIEHIMNSDNERELLAMAYMWESSMRLGDITSELYAKAMVLLSQKLGFGITEETLSEASAKYIKEQEKHVTEE